MCGCIPAYMHAHVSIYVNMDVPICIHMCVNVYAYFMSIYTYMCGHTHVLVFLAHLSLYVQNLQYTQIKLI